MIVTIVFVLLDVSLVLAFLRLIRGPSLPDRVVALDLMATVVVGMITAYAVMIDREVFLDLVVVLGLIVFLGTVAFAYFIEKGELPWRRS